MRCATVALIFVPCLAGCATAPAGAHRAAEDTPVLTAPFLAPEIAASPGGQDETASGATRMPIGVGFTAGPTTVMIGAALDFPMDDNLTIGPALQFGYDSDQQIFAPVAQVKYQLPGTMRDEESGVDRLRPYVTMGVGLAYIDKSGRSGDAGLLLNGGAGIRYRTGQDYRLGSELLLNWLPGEVADEKFYLSWELLQVVLDF